MMRLAPALVSLTLGATLMTNATTAAPPNAPPDASSDPRIDPRIRAFLTEVNKDPTPFWGVSPAEADRR